MREKRAKGAREEADSTAGAKAVKPRETAAVRASIGHVERRRTSSTETLARLASLACASLAMLGGCFVAVPREGARAVGTTSEGVILEGARLPDRGEGYVRARPGEGTAFGTPRLVAAIERAAASVWRELPGGEPLRVGDISSEGGGHHLRHRSHRAGRDVDILFYLVDAHGRPVEPAGWIAFSRFGWGRARDGGPLHFLDEARNWHLVRSFLTDPEADVQWIFCSYGVESRLLRYALAHEPDPELVMRASYVLLQPENALPHDDHFHVRVYCTAEERASGCQDLGPRWPWLRPELERAEGRDGPGLDDAALLDVLLAGDDPAA